MGLLIGEGVAARLHRASFYLINDAKNSSILAFYGYQGAKCRGLIPLPTLPQEALERRFYNFSKRSSVHIFAIFANFRLISTSYDYK